MSFYLNEAAGDIRDILMPTLEAPKAKLQNAVSREWVERQFCINRIEKSSEFYRIIGIGKFFDTIKLFADIPLTRGFTS